MRSLTEMTRIVTTVERREKGGRIKRKAKRQQQITKNRVLRYSRYMRSRCKCKTMGWTLGPIMAVAEMISATRASITLTTRTKTGMISMMGSMQVAEEAVVSPSCSIMGSKKSISLTRCSARRRSCLKKKRKLKKSNQNVDLNYLSQKLNKNLTKKINRKKP